MVWLVEEAPGAAQLSVEFHDMDVSGRAYADFVPGILRRVVGSKSKS